MTAEEEVQELLASLDAGETLDNVIFQAYSRGQDKGYTKGFQLGYLQACDEQERVREAAKHG